MRQPFQCGAAGIQLELWTATTKQPLDKDALDLDESLNQRVLRLACWPAYPRLLALSTN